MKVRNKTLALCHKFDDFIGKQVGFDATDSIAIHPFYLVDGFHQIKEILIVLYPKIAKVDTCKYNFFGPLLGGFFYQF